MAGTGRKEELQSAESISWIERGEERLVEKYAGLSANYQARGIEEADFFYQARELIWQAYFLKAARAGVKLEGMSLQSHELDWQRYLVFMQEPNEEQQVDLRNTAWRGLLPRGKRYTERDFKTQKTISCLPSLYKQEDGLKTAEYIFCQYPEIWTGWACFFSRPEERELKQVIGCLMASEDFKRGVSHFASKADSFFFSRVDGLGINKLQLVPNTPLETIRAGLEWHFNFQAFAQIQEMAKAAQSVLEKMLISQFGDRSAQAREVIDALVFSRTKEVPDTGFQRFASPQKIWPLLAAGKVAQARQDLISLARLYPANFSLKILQGLGVAKDEDERQGLIKARTGVYEAEKEDRRRDKYYQMSRVRKEKWAQKRAREEEKIWQWVEEVTGKKELEGLFDRCFYNQFDDSWRIVVDYSQNEDLSKTRLLVISKYIASRGRLGGRNPHLIIVSLGTLVGCFTPAEVTPSDMIAMLVGLKTQITANREMKEKRGQQWIGRLVAGSAVTKGEVIGIRGLIAKLNMSWGGTYYRPLFS